MYQYNRYTHLYVQMAWRGEEEEADGWMVRVMAVVVVEILVKGGELHL
jgi:hypothetical protein